MSIPNTALIDTVDHKPGRQHMKVELKRLGIARTGLVLGMFYGLRLQIILTSVLVGVIGCQSNGLKPLYTYPYVDATVDDLPPVDQIKAIAITGPAPLFMGDIVFLLGNHKTTEDVLGHEIWPDTIVDDRQWIERLTTHFKNAERVEEGKDLNWSIDWCHLRAVFITNSKGYIITVGETANVFYGVNFMSKQLYWDFQRLEEMVTETNKRRGDHQTLPGRSVPPDSKIYPDSGKAEDFKDF